jgi:hypothetical protein
VGLDEFVMQELNRFLEKEKHLTLEERISTCRYLESTRPEIGRILAGWLDQEIRGVLH